MARLTSIRVGPHARVSTKDQAAQLQLEDWRGAGIAKRKAGGLPARRQRVELDLPPALTLLREDRPRREVVHGTGLSIWMVDGTGIPATHSGGPT